MRMRVVVLGQQVASKIAALKVASVKPSAKVGGCYDSESLCTFQRAVSNAGYLEAEIVETNYGFSLRYASGLQNFGLIVRKGDCGHDGTYESIFAAAQRWVARAPEQRYVTAFLPTED